MSLVILGLGTALPTTSLTQDEAVRVAERLCCRDSEQAVLLPTLYRQTAIARRHLAFGQDVVIDILNGTRISGSVFLPRDGADDPGPTTAQRMEHYVREAGPLVLRAARQALAEARVPARDLTHLVTVSCTGFRAPGFDIELVKKLDLPATIERTHIGFMGCHGALNGLRVARAYGESQPYARVLLAAVELCGLHYRYSWTPRTMVSNALFADGAAALVGMAGDAASSGTWSAVASGSCLFPDSEQAMTWSIGDHGFEMTLCTKVPHLIARHLRAWLEQWLGQNGVKVTQVGSWAIHPGGPRILSAVEEALMLPRETTTVSREVLESCGNMSSPTVLFILDRLRQRNAPRPYVAVGFGPGLTAEAALFV
jgi:predicted naringenin-chalcone synthase